MLQIVIMANHTWRSEYNMTEFYSLLELNHFKCKLCTGCSSVCHGDPVFHQQEQIQTGLMQWLQQMWYCPRREMVLPFQPLSIAFNHINYFIDVPPGSSAFYTIRRIYSFLLVMLGSKCGLLRGFCLEIFFPFIFVLSILDFNQPQSSLCYCSQYQMQ
jgi:hypothetical protein